jgi:hypothetical protein
MYLDDHILSVVTGKSVILILTILMDALTFTTMYVITIITLAVGGKISSQIHTMS